MVYYHRPLGLVMYSYTGICIHAVSTLPSSLCILWLLKYLLHWPQVKAFFTLWSLFFMYHLHVHFFSAFLFCVFMTIVLEKWIKTLGVFLRDCVAWKRTIKLTAKLKVWMHPNSVKILTLTFSSFTLFFRYQFYETFSSFLNNFCNYKLTKNYNPVKIEVPI